MKKIFILLFFTFLLFSCGEENTDNTKKISKTKTEICKDSYKIDTQFSDNMKLKGVVIASENNIISSPTLGKITYLNCNTGKKVYPKTLIAKITPDYNDPNIKNLNTQKIDLNTQKINFGAQIANIKNNKISTSNSFDIQISNVDTQIISLKSQIEILKKNIENTKKTGKVSISDINIQINSLESQIMILKKNIENTKKTGKVNISDLNSQSKTLQDSIKKLVNSKELLKNSETNELGKLEVSKKNLLISMKNTIKDNLKIIDEIFGITRENRNLNDKFQDYLSAENRSLKIEVEKKFISINMKLYSFEKMTDTEISNYIKEIISLNNFAQKSVNASIENVYFTQARIDSLYKMFLTYSNSLANFKTNFDNFPESKKILKTNFANQLNSLENQIETSKNNLTNLLKNKKDSLGVNSDIQVLNLTSQLKTLENNLKNLKENKKNSVGVSVENQIGNLNSQLKSLESNIQNFYSNKKNLAQNKKTSLSSLDNQIIQLQNSIAGVNSNIKSININLSPVSLYAGVNGTVKQKFTTALNRIGPNAQICAIEPSGDNFKIKIFSPVDLNMGEKLEYEFNGKKYKTSITNILSYKDQITKNFVYESNYIDSKIFKSGEVLELKILVSSEKNTTKNNKKINKFIPVSYIKNKIEAKYIKAKTSSGVLDKKVQIGEISGDYIEIILGLEGVSEICK